MRLLLVTIGISIFFIYPTHAACTNPDGVPGEYIYNGVYDVFQGCTTQGWTSFHEPDLSCQGIGSTCEDGTLFIGLHPVTNARLFAMQEDAPTSLSWNKYNDTAINDTIDLPGNNTDSEPMNNCPSLSDIDTIGTGVRSRDPVHPHPLSMDPDKTVVTPGCHEGERMMNYLERTVNNSSPYLAASYCANLAPENDAVRALGYSDWYLPSINELSVMFVSLVPNTAYNFLNTSYWSSSEHDMTRAWVQNSSTGQQGRNAKYGRKRVRCIRQN